MLVDRLAVFARQLETVPPLWRRVFRTDAKSGFYIHGNVGTGKTFLMDILCDNIAITDKRRLHFNTFMLEVHSGLFALGNRKDPLRTLIEAMPMRLLCLDEFQVTDIADAMILRRILEVLFEGGRSVVVTSNRHPTELYKSGIQRTSFLPCIDLILERMEVFNLDAGTDYRRRRASEQQDNVYH